MTTTSPRTWTITLPWTKPPMSLNDRYRHWSQRNTRNREVRDTVHLLAYQAGIPALARCRVELVYEPRDSRARDADNMVATLKPACDGLVRAGVVPDDVPAFMEKPMPRIGQVSRPARLLLVVTELEASS